MDDASLKALLDALEKYRAALDSWLTLWTWIVVIGVALELVFAFHEHRAAVALWRPGIIRAPERPSSRWFVFELFAIALVTIGIGGELWVEAHLGTLETKIRNVNGQRLLLLQREAGSAEASAIGAAGAARDANAASGTAAEKANTANMVAGNALVRANDAITEEIKLVKDLNMARADVKHLRKEVDPRTLSRDEREKLIAALQEFSPTTQETVLINFDVDNAPDGASYAQDLVGAINDSRSRWRAEYGRGMHGPRNPKGVIIFIKDESTAPPWLDALRAALRAAGIEASVYTTEAQPPLTASIFINPRR